MPGFVPRRARKRCCRFITSFALSTRSLVFQESRCVRSSGREIFLGTQLEATFFWFETTRVKIQPKSHAAQSSAGRISLVSVIIFLVAHAALLIGITTPEKFVFDEVHYVPAARQMLEPVMPKPMLNPMHPPLAKQMIALSIRAFGDNPLGWRYPGTLFGALAIVAVYLCALALFRRDEPAIAAALIAC